MSKRNLIARILEIDKSQDESELKTWKIDELKELLDDLTPSVRDLDGEDD